MVVISTKEERKKTFHIIEDNPLHREFLADLISDEGYDVLSFPSASDYLQFFHSDEFQRPAAIITDVKMPGVQGDELVQDIHRKDALQPVVIITAYGENSKLEKVASRLCHILVKPYHPEELVWLLTSLSACHHTYDSKGQEHYPELCAFGLATVCPLNISIQQKIKTLLEHGELLK